MQRLLTADETRSKGASLKSLTLAPHIQHKRATYAVTCQVLQCELGCGCWQYSQGSLLSPFTADADYAQSCTRFREVLVEGMQHLPRVWSVGKCG